MPGPESALEIALGDARASDEAALTSLLMQTYHTTWAPMLRPEVAATFASGDRTRAYVQSRWPEFTVATLREDGPIVGMVHVTDDFIDALHVAPAPCCWRMLRRKCARTGIGLPGSKPTRSTAKVGISMLDMALRKSRNIPTRSGTAASRPSC